MDLVEEPVGEQRADGTIHETARERLLHRRAPLALEEATGKLARRRRTLAVITGERKEIDTSARCSGRCGHDDRRLRVAHEDGPGRLLRQLSRLDGEGVISDFSFDNRFHKNSSFFPARPTARPVHAVVTRGDGTEAHPPRYRTKAARRPRLGHVPNLQDSTTASADRPERPPQSGVQFPVARPRQQRTAGSIKWTGNEGLGDHCPQDTPPPMDQNLSPNRRRDRAPQCHARRADRVNPSLQGPVATRSRSPRRGFASGVGDGPTHSSAITCGSRVAG